MPPTLSGQQVERYQTSRGELRALPLGPAALHLEVVGHLDKNLGNLMVQWAARLGAASPRFTIFVDCSAMRGFDAEVRGTLRRFKVEFGDALTVHILMGSQLHAMLVAVARLSLGSTLIGYTSSSAFAAAVQKVRLGSGSAGPAGESGPGGSRG